MKKKIIVLMVAAMSFGITITDSLGVKACEQEQQEEMVTQDQFANMIDEILQIKQEHPKFSENEIKEIMDSLHDGSGNERGIFDIWNSLTDSEKTLCIRYPFDALKVNTARNIATEQTERKFGYSGLGDRSDAFRHGIWNAEMTIMIGKDKAELFATAHEDKDTTGNETDGFTKEEHKNMDLHNNEVGRNIGEVNPDATENEMADIIYTNIFQEDTQFIWLHE